MIRMRARGWCPYRAAPLVLLGAVVPLSCAAFVSFDDYSPTPPRDPGATYSVRGNVSGLEGSSVSMHLVRVSPAPAVSVSELTVGDGPFVFSDAGVDGSRFSLGLASQPLGHACSIKPDYVTIAGADVAGVAVSCPRQGPELSDLSVRLCLDEGVDGGPCDVGTAVLTPPFSQDTRAYTIRSADNCGAYHVCLSILATARYPGSTVSVRGLPLLAGKKRDLDLRRLIKADKAVSVDVTAPDGQTLAHYVVTIDYLGTPR